MRFKFDANQDFQLDAINAVVDIFEGQGRLTGNATAISGELLGVYPNNLTLSEKEIFANAKKVQERNGVKGSDESLDFSIEMETGTGKTYVYLRTIFELNKKYGWKKFIVLVPSVAIREGVIKTLNITREHFRELYDNTPHRFYEYQSKNITQVKHFASSNNIEIMVMTLGSFNKDANVLYSERDQMQGEKPMSYIQKTNPILILDEPQNMEGVATQEKLKEFNSLFRIRYSATHRTPFNLVYRLTPFDAYQLGLVKKIEVFSVVDEDNALANVYINLIDVKAAKNDLRASVEIFAKDNSGNIKKKKTLIKRGDDLSKKSSNPLYDGFIVEALTANAPDFGSIGSVRFKNGVVIKQGEMVGTSKEEVMKNQITETVKLHFEKREKLRNVGIKPLTLFFIDRVSSYVENDGFIRKTFTEAFNRLKNDFNLKGLDAAAVHRGYFAMKKEEYLERESSIAENHEAYELIMKDKERLLSLDEPTEFIFSHSALKEGWDNPNIFNICTLRMTSSPLRKRQEIGRGMRLCVNQNGERVFDSTINRLSVVANESYADYVAKLQSEFEEDGIYEAMPAPHNAKKRRLVKTKKDFKKDENFQALWSHISKKTRYLVDIDTPNLIERAAKKIKELVIPKPQIKIERAGITLTKEGVVARVLGSEEREASQRLMALDLIDYIKKETKLTRKTIAEMLTNANNFTAVYNNASRFVFEASQIIKEELIKDYVGQISYEVLPESFSVEQFQDVPSYQDAVQPVANSIYDAITFDSNVEKDFAIKIDHDERIKLFIKLPGWFSIDTPVGGYNPDWAIITAKVDLRGVESKEKVYFIIETKGNDNLRSVEQLKIDAAKKHFSVIDVRYKKVNNYDEFKEEYTRN